MQLIGLARLGRDADLKQTSNGKPVLNMALAYNYGQRKDGQQPTQWIECALFGDRAEKVAQYFLKGTAIVAYLDNVHVETYEKRDGTMGVKLVAMLASFEFTGKGGASGEADSRPTRTDQTRPNAGETPKPLPGNVQDMSDDIPFANPYRGRLAYVV